MPVDVLQVSPLETSASNVERRRAFWLAPLIVFLFLAWMWDSFYLFHGNFRFPLMRLTTDEIRANPPKPPLIGACVERDFPVVKELYPKVQAQLKRAQFICWQVPAE